MDNKIHVLANAFTKRLPNVLLCIMNEDQPVYIKGHFNGCIIRQIEDAMFCYNGCIIRQIQDAMFCFNGCIIRQIEDAMFCYNLKLELFLQ